MRWFVFEVALGTNPEIRSLFTTRRSLTDEERLSKAGPDRKSSFGYWKEQKQSVKSQEETGSEKLGVMCLEVQATGAPLATLHLVPWQKKNSCVVLRRKSACEFTPCFTRAPGERDWQECHRLYKATCSTCWLLSVFFLKKVSWTCSSEGVGGCIYVCVCI